jgi:hypothetical protein
LRSFAEALDGFTGCIRSVARRIVVVVYQPIESNYLIQVGEPIYRPSEVSRCCRFLCQSSPVTSATDDEYLPLSRRNQQLIVGVIAAAPSLVDTGRVQHLPEGGAHLRFGVGDLLRTRRRPGRSR